MKGLLDDFKAFGRVVCEVAEHISPEGRRGRVSVAGVPALFRGHTAGQPESKIETQKTQGP